MKAVKNYLKNVAHSIQYAAADIIKSDLAPNTSEFLDSNKELFTTTYSAIRNPKAAYKKIVNSATNSRYYTAIDYGARNIFQDLKTGKFYNRERDERDSMKFAGSFADIGGFDDLSEFGVDDFDNDSETDITTGDVKIIESIEASNRASTNTTVNTIIATATQSIKNSRANVGIIMTHNEKLFGGLHTDLAVLNASVDSITKLTGKILPNIDKNLADHFSNSIKLDTERNNILKEMLEMQRNMYKSAIDREREENLKRSSGRYSDISFGGMPDFNSYFKQVAKNISNELKNAGVDKEMINIMGDDSNPLAMMMTMPLAFIPKMLVKSVIPASVKLASKELDNTLSSIFPTMLGLFSNAKGNFAGGIFSKISKILGIDTSINDKIDTSKYYKGAVPFDGLTRKAIIDVIPTHLRKIEAALTGREERFYDYDSGKWTNAKDIKKKYTDIKESAVRQATDKIIKKMDKGIKEARSEMEGDARKEFDTAIEQFRKYLFDHHGIFRPERTAIENGIYYGTYRELVDFYDIIVGIYNGFDAVNINGKIKHTNNSVRMSIANDVLRARDNAQRQYRELERNGIGMYNQYFASIGVNEHGKFTKDASGKDVFRATNSILSAKDDYGNTIFNYLQEITAELRYQRQNGLFGFGGKSKRRKSSKSSMEDIKRGLINPAKFDEDRKINQKQRDAEAKLAREVANAISANPNLDYRNYDKGKDAYLKELSAILSVKATQDYYKEVGEVADDSVLSRIMANNIWRDSRAFDDVNDILDNGNYNVRITNNGRPSNSNVEKLLNRFKAGRDRMSSLLSAPAETFVNLLYAADRAVYDMMFKIDLKSSDGTSHNGVAELIAGKTNEILDKIKANAQDIFEPLKKALGIDDKFKEDFKESFKNMTRGAWSKFKDANKDVYGPLFNKAKGFFNKDGEDTSDSHARGTVSGVPYVGNTMLSKGELLFNSKGVSAVTKTGAYSITEPTHILNNKSSYPILKQAGLSKYASNQSIAKSLSDENRLKRKLFPNHADGTVNLNQKVDTEEVKKTIKQYMPEGLAGGAMGAIISTLLGIMGGPLLGAAVGYAGTILSHSETLKTKLFGEKDDNGKRGGGSLFNKTVMDSLYKYVPEITKYGLAGILPGLITPLGPVGGLMVGGTIGFLKNNEAFMDKYFGAKDQNGERRGGKLSLDDKTKSLVKKMMPGATKGAAAGAVATLFGGPFGLLGNAAIGAGLGLLTTTDLFKDSLIGKAVKGAREGGITGFLEEAFQPLKNIGIDIKDRFIKILDERIADPLSRFITPFIHELDDKINGLMNSLNNTFKEKFVRPITSTINDKLVKPLGGLVQKTIGPVFSTIGNIYTLPFRALGKFGDRLKTKQILSGRADYMTAEERMDYLQRAGKADKVSKFDEALSRIGKEGGTSIETAENLRNDLGALVDNKKKIEADRRSKNREINKFLDSKKFNGLSLSAKTKKEISKAINNGANPEEIKNILQRNALSDNSTGLTESQLKDLMSLEDGDGKSLIKLINEYGNLKTRSDRAGKLVGKDKSEVFNRSKDVLRQMGVSERELKKVKNVYDLKKYADLLDTDIIRAKAENAPFDSIKNEEEQTDELKKQSVVLNDILGAVLSIVNGKDNKSLQDITNRYNQTQSANSQLNNAFNNIQNHNKSVLGDEYNNLSDEDKDRLSSQDHTSKFSMFDRVGNKTINAVNDGKLRADQAAETAKGASISVITTLNEFGYNVNKEVIAYINAKLNSPTKKKSCIDFFKNKYVRAAIGNRKLTQDDIDFAISNVNKKLFFNHLKAVLKAGVNINGLTLFQINEIKASTIASAARENNVYNQSKNFFSGVKNTAGKAINGVKSLFGFGNDREENDVDNNGIGTFLLGPAASLLGGVGSLAGGLLGGIGSGVGKLIGGLFGNKSNEEQQKSAPLFNPQFPNVQPSASGMMSGNTGEVDDPNDGRSIVVDGDGNALMMKKQSDGSVAPDTSDNNTKAVLNKKSLKEKFTEKVQNAQLKAAELQMKLFGEEKNKSNKKSFKLLDLLIAGLFAAPLLKKIFDSTIKPVWSELVYPWIKDTAVPWISEKFDNFTNWLTTDVPEWLGKNLPDLLGSAIKTAFNIGGKVLDGFVGNKKNAGYKSSINTSDYDASTQTTMYDATGKKLTMGDIASGNYEGAIYNEQGQQLEITQDENGNNIINVTDGSKPGSSFLSKLANGGIHSFAQGFAGIGPAAIMSKATTKFGNFIGKFGLVGKAGKFVTNAISKPLTAATKAGEALSKTNLAQTLISKADEALEFLFSNNYVINKLKGLAKMLHVDDAITWIGNILTKIKGIFKNVLKEGAEKATEEVVEQTAKSISRKLLFWAFLLADFSAGVDKAESILRVRETTLMEEVAAGFANAICNLLVVPTFWPGVSAVATQIIKLWVDDVDERQQEAQAYVKEQNDKNGTSYSVEEMMEKENSIGGWVKDKVTGIAKGVKSTVGGIANFVSGITPKWLYSIDKNPEIKRVDNNAFGTLQPYQSPLLFNSPVAALTGENTNPNTIFKSVNENIDGIINRLTSFINTNDEIITDAKLGKVSIFKQEYWNGIKSDQPGLAGQIITLYNGMSRIMQVPIIMVSEIFGQFTNWIGGIAGNVGTNYKHLARFFSGTSSSSTKPASTSTSTTSSSSTSATSVATPSTQKSEGFFTKVFNGIKSLFGGSKYGTGYDKQNDPSIANIPYNAPGDTVKQTIGNSACGPAAAVTAVRSAYGRGAGDVVNAAKYALSRGYKEKNGGTMPGFFTDYFNRNGLNSTISHNKAELRNRILSGQPTVLMGTDNRGVNRDNPYGSNPHYVTATGVDRKGNVIIQDPESKYDNQLYRMNDVISKSSLGISAYGRRRKGGKGRFARGLFGRSKYGTGLRGSCINEQCYNFFIDNGFSAAAAAGAVGNLMWEAGMDANGQINAAAVESNGEGVGIVQWSFGRKTAFLNFCEENGDPFPNKNLELQLRFIKKELDAGDQWIFDSYSGYPSEYNVSASEFFKETSAARAAGEWCACYERPYFQHSNLSERQKSATEIYNKYSGNTPQAYDGSSMTTTDGGTVVEQQQQQDNSLIGKLTNDTRIGKSLKAFKELITGTSGSGTKYGKGKEDVQQSQNVPDQDNVPEYAPAIGTITPKYDTYIKSHTITPVYKNGNVTLNNRFIHKKQFKNRTDIMRNNNVGTFVRNDKRINTRVFGKSKYGRDKIQSDSNGLITNGTEIKIPSGLGKVMTYMGWQCITNTSSKQYKLIEAAGMNFDSEGFGIINGRYVIACTTTYGDIGDYIDFYLEDGTVLPTVMGDAKAQVVCAWDSNPANKWGHMDGQCVIEFVVDKNTWYSGGSGSHENPGSASCHPEWKQCVVKAVNGGSYFDDPTFSGGAVKGSGVSGDATSTAKAGLVDKIMNETKIGKAYSAFNELLVGSSSSSGSTSTSTGSDGTPLSGSTAEKAAQQMDKWAADDSHGYSQANRWGPDYDCSSSVIAAYEAAGVPLKSDGATYTGDMKAVALKDGFKDITSSVNLSNGDKMQRGDILLNQAEHVAMYEGNGKIVHASYDHGSPQTGDQSGKEFLVGNYYNHPWDTILRYDENSKSKSGTGSDYDKMISKLGIYTGDEEPSDEIKSSMSKSYNKYKKSLYGQASTPSKPVQRTSTKVYNQQPIKSIDYSGLIKVIIETLVTIADNTDKLGVIVDLLNERLDTNISTKDIVNKASSKESLKSKLKSVLQQSIRSIDTGDNTGINSIISVMNAIASE